MEYRGRQHGHYVIRLSHLVIARRLLKTAGTLISLSLPISITFFQVSYWSTSGQKSYVYFLFFSHCKVLVENWIWCPGAGWKIGQNSLFPPHWTICHTLSNEWPNKISAGVAILHRVGVRAIWNSSICVYSLTVNVGGECLTAENVSLFPSLSLYLSTPCVCVLTGCVACHNWVVAPDQMSWMVWLLFVQVMTPHVCMQPAKTDNNVCYLKQTYVACL